jgi:hypothetical protein
MDGRDHKISEMMQAGHSQRAIGQALGISGPAVAQRIARSPELRRLRTQCTNSEHQRLRAYRSELSQTYDAVRRLGLDIKGSIAALDEELEAIEIDRILGLR